MLTTFTSQYTCLGCGCPLPRGRGGHCDACVEWADAPPPALLDEPPGVPGEDTDPSAPPDLDPAPGRHLLFATKTTARAWLEEDWRRDAQARAWSQGLHDAAERNKG